MEAAEMTSGHAGATGCERKSALAAKTTTAACGEEADEAARGRTRRRGSNVHKRLRRPSCAHRHVCVERHPSRSHRVVLEAQERGLVDGGEEKHAAERKHRPLHVLELVVHQVEREGLLDAWVEKAVGEYALAHQPPHPFIGLPRERVGEPGGEGDEWRRTALVATFLRGFSRCARGERERRRERERAARRSVQVVCAVRALCGRMKERVCLGTQGGSLGVHPADELCGLPCPLPLSISLSLSFSFSSVWVGMLFS
eukprot:scaffold98291_cov32-Tisochrysis_lutea.AAC.5